MFFFDCLVDFPADAGGDSAQSEKKCDSANNYKFWQFLDVRTLISFREYLRADSINRISYNGELIKRDEHIRIIYSKILKILMFVIKTVFPKCFVRIFEVTSTSALRSKLDPPVLATRIKKDLC